jgi:hypothetical protein
MSPLLLLFPTLWLLVATFVVLLCRCAARGDAAMLAASRAAEAAETRELVSGFRARITQPLGPDGPVGTSDSTRETVLVHRAQTRAQLGARFRGAGARTRRARCAQRP